MGIRLTVGVKIAAVAGLGLMTVGAVGGVGYLGVSSLNRHVGRWLVLPGERQKWCRRAGELPKRQATPA